MFKLKDMKETAALPEKTEDLKASMEALEFLSSIGKCLHLYMPESCLNFMRLSLNMAVCSEISDKYKAV